MFEKEAEERTDEKYVCNEYEIISLEAIGYKKGFKDGAKFGYNEANEWHDLRKNPNDLPKGHKVVLNQIGEKTTYDPDRGFLGFGGCGIIAWKEIPLFKESE